MCRLGLIVSFAAFIVDMSLKDDRDRRYIKYSFRVVWVIPVLLYTGIVASQHLRGGAQLQLHSQDL